MIAQLKAVDLFAGLGGFSEGARNAGVKIVWAANHWKSAVETHAANHPETDHACQDLHQTADQINEAYRAKAKILHPDSGGAHDDMVKLNEAYRAATSQR